MRKSILVVDDDPAIGKIMAATLGRRYRLRLARTSTETIEAICNDAFNLIFLDYDLPHPLGADLLKLLKRFFPATPVVLITGQGLENEAPAGVRGGTGEYLRKPFTAPDLEARVESALARPRAGPNRGHASDFHLAAASTPVSPGSKAGGTRPLIRAIRYIDAHFNARLTLARVARVAGMSKCYFCRRFKAVTGLSFRVFLAQKRIARAKELLQKKGQRIRDVAREVGFRDPTHFGRVFRKYEHLLPSEFRTGPTLGR